MSTAYTESQQQKILNTCRSYSLIPFACANKLAIPYSLSQRSPTGVQERLPVVVILIPLALRVAGLQVSILFDLPQCDIQLLWVSVSHCMIMVESISWVTSKQIINLKNVVQAPLNLKIVITLFTYPGNKTLELTLCYNLISKEKPNDECCQFFSFPSTLNVIKYLKQIYQRYIVPGKLQHLNCIFYQN